jgi:hypothetical protein
MNSFILLNNRWRRSLLAFSASLFLAGHVTMAQQAPKQLRDGTKYKVYPDRVEQGSYSARAVSSREISSTYQSEANLFIKPSIDFKFSINGKDNEMASGIDHHFNCLATGNCETPLIEFGKQYNDASAVPGGVYIQPHTKLKMRLDMRKVSSSLPRKDIMKPSTDRRSLRKISKVYT